MRKPLILSSIILFLICLFSVSGFTSDYTVGPGDVLKIGVFKEKDFTGDFKISSKGMLNYPVIGDIDIRGKTEEEIKAILMEILAKDYLQNPKVTVAVKEYNSQKVLIVGSVVKPGVYSLKRKTYLLDIVSMAGGISKGGSKKIVVLRKIEIESDRKLNQEKDQEKIPLPKSHSEKSTTDKEVETISIEIDKEELKNGLPGLEDEFPKVSEDSKTEEKSEKSEEKDQRKIISDKPSKLIPLVVNYSKILSGGDLSQNIEIKGGDIVNIPKANEVYVFGSVQKPGPVPFAEDMGVLQAVTQAGGPTPEASQRSTYILRMSKKGKEEKIKVNLSKVLKQKSKNIAVKPNDVIVIPESFF